MRVGSESTSVWSKFKIELDKRHWDYQRIEDKHHPGIPDVNIHIPGTGDVWIEMKYVEVLTTLSINPSINLTLRPEQYIWLLQGARAGRKVCLLARIATIAEVPEWWVWFDAGAWALARRSTKWLDLQATGVNLNSPAEVLDRLAIRWSGRRD